MSAPIDPAETDIQVALRLALASVVGSGLLTLAQMASVSGCFRGLYRQARSLVAPPPTGLL